MKSQDHSHGRGMATNPVTQTFTSDLFNKKRHIRGPYQCLQAPTVGFLQDFTVEFQQVPRNRPIRKATRTSRINPPTNLIFTLKVSTPLFPPLGFFSGAEGATVLFIWVIFGSEVKLCDEGCQGISRTGSMNPGSTQVRGKTQIRVGPNATTLEVDVWQEKSLHPQGELEENEVCVQSIFTAGV